MKMLGNTSVAGINMTVLFEGKIVIQNKAAFWKQTNIHPILFEIIRNTEEPNQWNYCLTFFTIVTVTPITSDELNNYRKIGILFYTWITFSKCMLNSSFIDNISVVDDSKCIAIQPLFFVLYESIIVIETKKGIPYQRQSMPGSYSVLVSHEERTVLRLNFLNDFFLGVLHASLL